MYWAVSLYIRKKPSLVYENINNVQRKGNQRKGNQRKGNQRKGNQRKENQRKITNRLPRPILTYCGMNKLLNVRTQISTLIPM
jgi:hypothetical protein